jgi:hypothetical protein
MSAYPSRNPQIRRGRGGDGGGKLFTRIQKLRVTMSQHQSFQNIHFPHLQGHAIFRFDMISSIAAKRTTSSMPSPSIISTTTKSSITATGGWRN